MKTPDASYFNIGPRLTLTFAVLLALILGGNALLLWQFHIARLETDRLTAVNQQVISVLRLQESLVYAHERLDQLAKTRDAHRLLTEAEPLRKALLDQTQSTRSALTLLPSNARTDPAFRAATPLWTSIFTRFRRAPMPMPPTPCRLNGRPYKSIQLTPILWAAAIASSLAS